MEKDETPREAWTWREAAEEIWHTAYRGFVMLSHGMLAAACGRYMEWW